MKVKNLFLIFFIAGLANAQGTWTQMANFGGGIRNRGVGFSIGAKGYIGTGMDTANLYKDFWEWDQATNIWTQKADFGGSARYNAVGFSIGTKGYIGTGDEIVGTGGEKDDFWEWDQNTNTWTQKANFGGAVRYGAISFSIDTKGYIGTGYYNGIYYPDFWEWDQTTDKWVQRTDFVGTARYSAVGFSIGTKGYVGTGEDASGNLCNDFYEYNPHADTLFGKPWIKKKDFAGTERYGSVGFTIGSRGYLGTGRGKNAAFFKDFFEYNPAADTLFGKPWAQKASFGATARLGAVGFCIGTKGYIGTGGLKQDFWEFDTTLNGASEIDLSKFISIYPNPTNGCFQITSKELQIIAIEIYNLQGERISSISYIQPAHSIIDISSQPSGIYFLKVLGSNFQAFKKIVRE